MHYVISDIHGCYNEYLEILKAINFNSDDTLYVLGDCIDRGEDSIKVLKDMMKRPNVVPILGNHEFVALSVLNDLCMESTEDNIETNLSFETMQKYYEWVDNGGETMLEEFRTLPLHEKLDIIDYLESFSLYKEVRVNERNYLLVHGGLEPFREGMGIKDFTTPQLLYSSADLNRTYFQDAYTITGHTPTVFENGNKGTVIKRNNHIAIDCGCVFGYNLAVYCMETDEEVYVPSAFYM